MRVRLYGRFTGHSSHAQVTYGFEQVLCAEGLLAGTVALDAPTDLDEAAPPGALAPAGVFTGPLGMAARMTHNARHPKRYVMVAPNSNLLPAGMLVYLVAHVTDLLAPSAWAAGVLREQCGVIGRPDVPVHRVPHGVDASFAMDTEAREAVHEAYREGEFRVLHFSTSDRQRKGTLELVEAWKMLRAKNVLPAKARLRLVLDYAAVSALQERMVDAGINMPEGVDVATRLEAHPKRMAALLGSAHVVCQPSRGEAFGMLGTESLSCGVPIVATNCTGHEEWLGKGRPGALVVPTGPLAPIDDLPGAVGPSLEVTAVAEALRIACEDWLRLAGAAERTAAAVAAEWAWPRQLSEFVMMLLRLPD